MVGQSTTSQLKPQMRTTLNIFQIYFFAIKTSNARSKRHFPSILFSKWTNPKRHFLKTNYRKDISWMGSSWFFIPRISIQHILTKELGMECVCQTLVPHFLLAKEMGVSFSVCSGNLTQISQDPNFLSCHHHRFQCLPSWCIIDNQLHRLLWSWSSLWSAPFKDGRILIKWATTSMESRFTLQLNAAKNTDNIRKMLQIQIVQNSISYKKLSGSICLSIPGVGVGVSKDCHVWNICSGDSGNPDDLGRILKEEFETTIQKWVKWMEACLAANR